VQDLVLDVGEHVSVGEIVAEQAVDGFRADLCRPVITGKLIAYPPGATSAWITAASSGWAVTR
jgi:hypothetical protein